MALGSSSSFVILPQECVLLCKEQLIFVGWMERRSPIPPLAAAFPWERVGDAGRHWEHSLGDPAEVGRGFVPSTHFGRWLLGSPAWGAWAPRSGQSHLCTAGTSLTSIPISNSHSGYWDSAPDCFMLFLFHPPAIIFCCSSEITAKLCCSFFFPPSIINFFSRVESFPDHPPPTYTHACTHTL